LIGIPQHPSSADRFVRHRTHLDECTSISEKAASSGGFGRRVIGPRPPGSRFLLAIGTTSKPRNHHALIVAARQAASSGR
jgi:hypothetical protein